jgi:hypothetical protein
VKNTLLGLVYVKKEKGNYEISFNSNKLYSCRLLLLLLRNALMCFSQMLVFYLKIIYHHTKSNVVERIYLAQLTVFT